MLQSQASTSTRAELTGALDGAIQRALAHLAEHQDTDGSWHGDYGGPMFLLPMYVGVSYATRRTIDSTTRDEMKRYLLAQQNDDGGFGLHIEGASHVFTSVLNYVALRMLGLDARHRSLHRCLQFVSVHGGPLASASWGKFFLALLNLYDYRGLNPVPPELWLMPRRLPVHPSRLWCHCRMVYLPMSFLYGRRFQMPRDPLVEALRSELYPAGYDETPWHEGRTRVSPTDAYVRISPLMRTVNRLLWTYERRPNARLRARALEFVLEQIRMEDRNTRSICIGPINKLFHTLIWYLEDPDGSEFRTHVDQLDDYLHRGPDGIKMQGYNSSQLWDTAFAVQAATATDLATRRHGSMLERAHGFIDRTQVREDVPEREACFRDPSRGGWPFSTRPHGWPISDCTAEALKACLASAPHVSAPLSDERLGEAALLILWLQNDDGGWPTYERQRGPSWLERLNPSDCFGDIMVDYSYVECTSACLQALDAYRRACRPRDNRIDRAMDRGREFLLHAQRADGSWEGSWGICFTYGTWFGVWGLLASGCPPEHPSIQAAAEFLLSKQGPDGGWGEHADSCRSRRYIATDGGQTVMTSWALLALMAAGYARSEPVVRGLGFLLQRQREDGSWPPEHIAGMFNKTCAIHYDNYLKIFPLWCLSMAAEKTVDATARIAQPSDFTGLSGH